MGISDRERTKTMSKDIQLSDRYGVNPSVAVCLCCQEPMGVAVWEAAGRRRGASEGGVRSGAM